jgi:hypothetical protein
MEIHVLCGPGSHLFRVCKGLSLDKILNLRTDSRRSVKVSVLILVTLGLNFCWNIPYSG